MTCIKQLQTFFEASTRNIWLEDKQLHVYVRKGRRYLEKDTREIVSTLDIASIEVCKPGKGIGTLFINEAHKINPFFGTYIESILNDKFLRHLLTKGWISVEGSTPPCVYKKV
jgi:hypothetical protein